MTSKMPRGRPRKILEAIFALSPTGPKLVTYEDIVVKAWELYPDDFGLRGYSDRYPDSGDIHIPLYKELKSTGLVASGPARQKRFQLTPAGWDLARRLFDGEGPGDAGSGRLTRSTAEELSHLERAAATNLYLSGEGDAVLDTDFYAFYRTSVRAPSREFESRIAQTRLAIAEAVDKRDPRASALADVERFLAERFSDIVMYKTDSRTKKDE
jgi:hypothetical protein